MRDYLRWLKRHRYMVGGLFVLALVTATVIMLTTGCIWRTKATTLIGGGALSIFVLIVIGSVRKTEAKTEHTQKAWWNQLVTLG